MFEDASTRATEAFYDLFYDDEERREAFQNSVMQEAMFMLRFYEPADKEKAVSEVVAEAAARRPWWVRAIRRGRR